MTQTATRQLQCMEVWGGNQAGSTLLAMPGLDVWIYSQPAGGARGGGDVHYASSCAAGALSRLLLADVSGHGQQAAYTARRLRRLMQRHINHHTQTGFVASMNHHFAKLAKNGRFATAVAFTYDAPLNRLEVCIAGHPPPLIRRAAEKKWSYIEPPGGHRQTNIPLGIERIVAYEQFELPINFGDLVLAYSDALPECRGTDGKMLGGQGLLKLINRLDVSDPSTIIPSLIQQVQTVASIQDDLTIMLLRPNGSRPFVPLRDKLLAPIRMVRALVQAHG